MKNQNNFLKTVRLQSFLITKLKSLWFLLFTGIFILFLNYFLIGTVAQKLYRITGSTQISDLDKQYIEKVDEYLKNFIKDPEKAEHIKTTPYLHLMIKISNLLAFPLIIPALISRVLDFLNQKGVKRFLINLLPRPGMFRADVASIFLILSFYSLLAAAVEVFTLSQFDIGLSMAELFQIQNQTEKIAISFLLTGVCLLFYGLIANELFSTFSVYLYSAILTYCYFISKDTFYNALSYLLPSWSITFLWDNSANHFLGIMLVFGYGLAYLALTYVINKQRDLP